MKIWKAAFAGESQARNKYTYFAAVARKEGYHYIANIFEETADNERRHAKDEFAMTGGIGDTAANLKAAFDGEDFEVKDMYPKFAEEAEAEGNHRSGESIPSDHKSRSASSRSVWKTAGFSKKRILFLNVPSQSNGNARVCGYVHEGTEPPAKCPCCAHPMEYYEPANMDF